MAYLEEKTCPRCHENFQGTDKYEFCNKCSAIIEAEKKEKWLKEWRRDLKLEERIAKIEEWIYALRNYDLFSISNSDQTF